MSKQVNTNEVRPGSTMLPGLSLFLGAAALLLLAAGCVKQVDSPPPTHPLEWSGEPEYEGAVAVEKRVEVPEDSWLSTRTELSEVEQEIGGIPRPLPRPEPPIGTLQLSLGDAINRALFANRSLLNSVDSVESARLGLVSAYSEFELKIRPAVGGSYGNNDGEQTDSWSTGFTLDKKFLTGTEVSAGPSIGETDGDKRIGFDVDATQPLLRGFSPSVILNGVKSAEFAARSARRALYLTQVGTVITTVSNYFNAVRQRELLRVNEESLRRLRENLEAAQAKEKIGISNQLDVLRAEVELQQTEDAVTQTRDAYQDALDNLKILLALDLDSEIDLASDIGYDLLAINEDDAVMIALAERVELEQAEDNLSEARRGVRVAKNNTLPQLDLNLAFSQFGSGSSYDDASDLDEESWSVGLTSSTDLFRTAERAALARSRISVNVAERGLELQEEEIIRQVRRSVREVRRSARRIDIQREAVDKAEGQLAVATAQFTYGLADNFDVINAETNLRRAQTNLLSAILDYIIGTYQLRANMGTLIERPEFYEE